MLERNKYLAIMRLSWEKLLLQKAIRNNYMDDIEDHSGYDKGGCIKAWNNMAKK